MDTNSYQYGEGNEYLSLDYSRCQRPDGSYYGTGGVCRKGAPVGAKEKSQKSLSSISDKQLQDLSNRPEIPADQKKQLMAEIDKRKSGILRPISERNNEKSPNELKAEAEKDKADRDKLRAQGGYAPKGGRSNTSKDEEMNILYLEETLNLNRMDALKVKVVADKMIANGASLGDDRSKPKLDVTEQGIALRTRTKSNKAFSELYINRDGTVGWTVNNNYLRDGVSRTGLSRKDKLEIATASKQSWDIMVKSLPAGTLLNTTAATADGAGSNRVKAYQTMGFSKPYRNKPGNEQLAIITKTGVKPITRAKAEDMTLFGLNPALLFSEQQSIEQAIYTILFGRK